eukprot:487714_1
MPKRKRRGAGNSVRNSTNQKGLSLADLPPPKRGTKQRNTIVLCGETSNSELSSNSEAEVEHKSDESASCPSSQTAVDHNSVEYIKRRLRLQLLSESALKESLEECGLESQRRELYDILDRSVSSLENVSTLLIGYSGVGKSMVLRHVFCQLREKHGSDSFLEMHLNGHFHADETATMRTICRTLDAKYSE